MGDVVDLRIAGQNYRVTSSASASDLRRLAAVVNEKIAQLPASARSSGPSAVLLAALSLANDLDDERGRAGAFRQRTRELLGRIHGRVDVVLETSGLVDAGRCST